MGNEREYKLFEKLLEKNNVSTYKVALATSIPQSTFSDWKTGRSKPKVDKLQKIAKYFGVTVDYFL